MNIYQGGIPSIYTKYGNRQQGSGFLSGLKRFLIPLARTALPHVAGVVGDLVSGKKPLETLKSRGRAAGADIIETVGEQASQALRKGIKRKQPPKKIVSPPHKRRKAVNRRR